MSIQTFTKDPAAVTDYALNWAPWLAADETISTSTWSISPAGPTLGLSSFAGKEAVQWVSGGTAGTNYLLSNTITTSQGRTDKRTVTIKVENR